MRKIREVLRLRDEHAASQRQIVAACRLPRSTGRGYLRRLRAAGLTHAAVATWTDGELEARLFARSGSPPRRPEPNWAAIARELGRRGVTLQQLWREYLDEAPEGYRYTQFVARFRARERAHEAPRLRREHRPGDAVEVDDAGMTHRGVGDAARPAQVFLALGGGHRRPKGLAIHPRSGAGHETCAGRRARCTPFFCASAPGAATKSRRSRRCASSPCSSGTCARASRTIGGRDLRWWPTR